MKPPRCLPYVASMGFDVLYLPPIHPIGRSFRKGPNNSTESRAGDPGSPWAIGPPRAVTWPSSQGSGRSTTSTASSRRPDGSSLEMALDIAFQASPDHPYVTAASGLVPPSPGRHDQVRREPAEEVSGHLSVRLRVGRLAVALARADLGVLVLDRPRGQDLPGRQPPHQAVRVLGMGACRHPARVARRDLPLGGFHAAEGHAPPRQAWVLPVLHVLHLAEHQGGAHRVLHRADRGQPVREYLRPNLFANTPDILHEYLQRGGKPAFQARLVLAATLGASYGIYSGFELLENVPVRAGSEEYLDSEKYQIRPRDFGARGQSGRADRSGERDPERASRAAVGLDARISSDRQRSADLLQQAHARRKRPRARRREPRSGQHAARLHRAAASGLERAADADDRRARPAVGRALYWRASRNYVRLDPQDRVAHILPVRW